MGEGQAERVLGDLRRIAGSALVLVSCSRSMLSAFYTAPALLSSVVVQY